MNVGHNDESERLTMTNIKHVCHATSHVYCMLYILGSRFVLLVSEYQVPACLHLL